MPSTSTGSDFLSAHLKVCGLQNGSEVERFFDSDHIALQISLSHDREDRFEVRTLDAEKLNARAVMNGIMANSVKLVAGARMGLPVDDAAYFDKARTAISNGFGWLESRAGLFCETQPTYGAFHLVSAWDHVALDQLVPQDFPQLAALVQGYSDHPEFVATAPPPR